MLDTLLIWRMYVDILFFGLGFCFGGMDGEGRVAGGKGWNGEFGYKSGIVLRGLRTKIYGVTVQYRTEWKRDHEIFWRERTSSGSVWEIHIFSDSIFVPSSVLHNQSQTRYFTLNFCSCPIIFMWR